MSPKNLQEAIILALMKIPMCEIESKGSGIIRDYLSQKFTAAYLAAKDEDEVKGLKDLWHSIING